MACGIGPGRAAVVPAEPGSTWRRCARHAVSGVGSFFDAGLEAVADLLRGVRLPLPLAARDHHTGGGYADDARKSYDLPYLHDH